MIYYSTQRPITLGTFPNQKGNRIIRIKNFDSRTYVDAIGREAWGQIEYDKPLPRKLADSYELAAENETFSNVEDYMEKHEFSFADKEKVRKVLKDAEAAAAVLTQKALRFANPSGEIQMVTRADLGIAKNMN